jgi:DNA invertase Pin-like site-specific DNA recombinase
MAQRSYKKYGAFPTLTPEQISIIRQGVEARKKLKREKTPITLDSLTPHCVAYMRVSDLRQDTEGFSPEVQTHRCLAEFRRLQRLDVHNPHHIPPDVVWGGFLYDQGVSAFTTAVLDRKAGSQLGNLNPGDHLIIVRPDRMCRRLHDLLNFVNYYAKPKRITLHFIDGPLEDIAKAAGMAFLQLLGVVAELESAIKSERMREFIAYRKETGQANIGPAPFGYKHGWDKAGRRIYVPNWKQIEKMAQTVELWQRGVSIFNIVIEMNRRIALAHNVPAANVEKWLDKQSNYRKWGYSRVKRSIAIFIACAEEAGLDPLDRTTADPYRLLGVSDSQAGREAAPPAVPKWSEDSGNRRIVPRSGRTPRDTVPQSPSPD